MKVLSGSPDYVSGGDSRIEVSTPSAGQAKLEFWLNDKQIASKASKGLSHDSGHNNLIVPTITRRWLKPLIAAQVTPLPGG